MILSPSPLLAISGYSALSRPEPPGDAPDCSLVGERELRTGVRCLTRFRRCPAAFWGGCLLGPGSQLLSSPRPQVCNSLAQSLRYFSPRDTLHTHARACLPPHPGTSPNGLLVLLLNLAPPRPRPFLLLVPRLPALGPASSASLLYSSRLVCMPARCSRGSAGWWRWLVGGHIRRALSACDFDALRVLTPHLLEIGSPFCRFLMYYPALNCAGRDLNLRFQFTIVQGLFCTI